RGGGSQPHERRTRRRLLPPGRRPRAARAVRCRGTQDRSARRGRTRSGKPRREPDAGVGARARHLSGAPVARRTLAHVAGGRRPLIPGGPAASSACGVTRKANATSLNDWKLVVLVVIPLSGRAIAQPIAPPISARNTDS